MVTFFGGCLPSKNGRIKSWTWLLSLNFAFLSFSPFTTGNETTCRTRASEGSLQIACNFPKNINTTKSSFCVYHFTSKGTSVVLACNWLDDQLACFTEEGFKIPKHVSNTFITEVEGHVNGDFGCDILPRSSKSTIKPCKRPAHKGVAEPRGDSQANAKNIFMDAKNNTTVNNADPVNCNHYCPWICSVLILIILLLMLLIFLMKWNKSTEVLTVLWCRRPKHKQQKETPYKMSEAPSHQNGSVKQSSPINDISVSVQWRTPDEKQPWLSSGPEKFRNDASMHST